MRIGQPIDLAVHRRQHIRMRVSEAGNRRPAAGIKIRFSLGIKDIGPCAREATIGVLRRLR
jgi:hypothetical protein